MLRIKCLYFYLIYYLFNSHLFYFKNLIYRPSINVIYMNLILCLLTVIVVYNGYTVYRLKINILLNKNI